MLSLPRSVRVYLACEAVDMRKSIDGLCGIVRNQWQADEFSGHLFVFLGKKRDRVKVLCWDRGGFVLYYKRLEQGRFRLPEIFHSTEKIELEAAQLMMLLDGIDYSRVRRPHLWQPAQERRNTKKIATGPKI